jgi:hypothetical protein
LGDNIENEMGVACSVQGGEERANLRERDHLRYPGLDGRIIFRWIFRSGGMDWIKLALDRDRWQALVNAIMNLQVP